jgi:excisionase family DNA binding protein
MSASSKKFISTQELGNLLGVTRQTVRNWVVRGQIRAFKIGQNLKIPKEEAVRILSACEQPIPDWLRSGDKKVSNKP